jgi:hypothetical protein
VSDFIWFLPKFAPKFPPTTCPLRTKTRSLTLFAGYPFMFSFLTPHYVSFGLF